MKSSLWIASLGIFLIALCEGKPPVADNRETHNGEGKQSLRVRREVSLNDRLKCDEGDIQPPNRVNTTLRLSSLRGLMQRRRDFMKAAGIKAYIIPTDDAHSSEYVAEHDNRRAFITGFTGSAGSAVVTLTEAALWTDGRYFLQADQQLDCNWLLMKEGMSGVPSITEWLKSVLVAGDSVGADPKLVNAETWLDYKAAFADAGILYEPVLNNLIDGVWGPDQPPYPSAPAYVHEIDFAGRTWEEKLEDIRADLEKNDVNAIVITALDEVAWALNLRGSDISYNPVFRSFLVVNSTGSILYIPPEKVTESVMIHLKSRNCAKQQCVEIRDYETIYTELQYLAYGWSSVILPRRYSYSGGASYALYDLVPPGKIALVPSPVVNLKAKKNPTEVEGMQRAHIKDAVALCDFMAKIEREIKNNTASWDELKVVAELNRFRAQQNDSAGPSFFSIAGFGANGAVIHYEPTTETNIPVNADGVLLLDSGGQYLDGTTDITRTFHFGRPTEWQKETYTRVLMGHIDLGLLVFPEGTTDKDIDIIARAPLYAAGLDYRHGTGHGIGAFLFVHEGPIQVRDSGPHNKLEENYYFSDALDLTKGYLENTYMSHEPGYYEEGSFGIRIESIVRVVAKNTTHNFGGVKYYGFEHITLFPFEPALIVPEMMSVKQKKWLNEYNAQIRVQIGEALKKQGRMDGFYWMMEKTNAVTEECADKSSATNVIPTVVVVIASYFALRF